MFDVTLLLHGRAVRASDGATYERLNPITGEIATRAAAATIDDAVPGWSSTGPGERRKRLGPRRAPVGDVVGFAPWSALVILGVRAIAMPLDRGATVVLKGSEIRPRAHRLIGEAFQAAGHGEGAVNVVETSHRIWHLSHQWADCALRGANAVRRRRGVRLQPFRRRRRHSRIHGTAIDHHRLWQGAISDPSTVE